MDVGVVCEQTFLRCMEEVSAVVDAGLFTRSTAEDLGLPGVEMGVEVNDAHGPVFTAWYELSRDIGKSVRLTG